MSKLSYSLEGEDVLAASLLRSVSAGRYLDIGCSDPVEISNTYFFYQRGWRGICVDGRSDLSERWAEIRPGDSFVSCVLDETDGERTFYSFPDPTMNTCDAATASRYSERFLSDSCRAQTKKTRSARSIWLEAFGADAPPPDLVSLDVEGFELPILRGLIIENWRPALLIVETKLFTFDSPTRSSIYNYFKNLGYIMIAKTPLDGFFIDPANPMFSWVPPAMRAISDVDLAR